MPAPDAKLTFIHGLPLTRDAVEFVRERHSGQRRRGDHAEFVVHPLEVASLLERSHYPDRVVAAAVLHDVLEDTGAERGELEARFGTEVAQLVSTLSDDPAVSDAEARKDEVRERVRRTGGCAAAIYAADKVSKVRELRMLLVVGISEEEAQIRLKRYRRSLRMLEETIPGSRLVELLRFELEALERLPPEEPPSIPSAGNAIGPQRN
jgi:(p)ppGpp synthase/HD superfamily hydrolase